MSLNALECHWALLAILSVPVFPGRHWAPLGVLGRPWASLGFLEHLERPWAFIDVLGRPGTSVASMGVLERPWVLGRRF
jgi:hypothetical protein